MEDCLEVGIKAAVIISAGFKETGAEGAQLERGSRRFQVLPTTATGFAISTSEIAIIGASDKEGSVRRTLIWNLMRSTFGGTIYPINVNPRKKNVFGVILICCCFLFTVLSDAGGIAYSTLYSLLTRSSPTREYKMYRPVMVKLTWQ